MAHEGLWQQVEKLDGQQTAKRAKCQYLTDPERYVVTLLKTDHEVNLSDRTIFGVQPGSAGRRPPQGVSMTVEEPVPAEFLEQLCILAYLINAKDVPLAGKLVRPQALPAGQFFFRGLHSLPTEKLQKTFGHRPELLHAAAEQFDGRRCDFGDASIQLYVLPRVPLTIVIWRGDEQFAARASILFDETASEQLALDALLVAVELAVKALIKAAQESS